jgi:hypothetical protein
MRSPILVSFCALALPACASRGFVYEPVTTTSAEVVGRPAASYPIPATGPQGSAELVSFGLAEVQGEDEATRALCMRLIVANRSDRSWSVDARVQALVFDDGQEVTPKYALAADGQPPVVEIPAGGTRAIDLFFPLPAGIEDARALPRFDAVWSVRTPTRVVTGRTPFARISVTPRAYSDVSAPFWMDHLNPAFSSITLVRLEGPYVHRGAQGF